MKLKNACSSSKCYTGKCGLASTCMLKHSNNYIVLAVNVVALPKIAVELEVSIVPILWAKSLSVTGFKSGTTHIGQLQISEYSWEPF